MVKVREDQPLTESGKVDIQQWLTRLQEDVRLREPERLLQACELADQLEREAPAPIACGCRLVPVFAWAWKWPIFWRTSSSTRPRWKPPCCIAPCAKGC